MNELHAANIIEPLASLNSAVSALITLEKCSPYILESYLRGLSWNDCFDRFYKLKCPLFKGYFKTLFRLLLLFNIRLDC